MKFNIAGDEYRIGFRYQVETTTRVLKLHPRHAAGVVPGQEWRDILRWNPHVKRVLTETEDHHTCTALVFKREPGPGHTGKGEFHWVKVAQASTQRHKEDPHFKTQAREFAMKRLLNSDELIGDIPLTPELRKAVGAAYYSRKTKRSKEAPQV